MLVLSWRNLWRHRLRTWLMVLVLAYATWATVVFWSCVEGYAQTVTQSHAWYILAPMRVASAKWFADPDPQHALPDLTLLDNLQTLHWVRGLAPRLEFHGLIRSAYQNQRVVVRGVEPLKEFGVSKIPNRVGQGQWLQQPGQVVLGYRLAQRMDARVGERIIIDSTGMVGTRSRGLRVVGLIHAGIPAVDLNAVIIHIQDARLLSGVSSATMIEVGVLEDPARYVDQLRGLLPSSLQARTVWDLMSEPIKVDIQATAVEAIPIGLLLALFSALAVSNTVSVNLLERTRELGLVLALGMTPGRLALMVLIEALLAALLGWGIGLVAGYATALYLATHNVLGVFFARAGEAFASAGVAREFYAALRSEYIVYSLLTVVLAGLFSLLAAAPRIGALKPVQALKMH